MSFGNLAPDRKVGIKDWRYKKTAGILEFTNSESKQQMYVLTCNFWGWNSDISVLHLGNGFDSPHS